MAEGAWVAEMLGAPIGNRLVSGTAAPPSRRRFVAAVLTYHGRLARARKHEGVNQLGPDSKSQVTVRYHDGAPVEATGQAGLPIGAPGGAGLGEPLLDGDA